MQELFDKIKECDLSIPSGRAGRNALLVPGRETPNRLPGF